MPFEIIRNDITRVDADAIVSTANPKPCIGVGTERAIHLAAGERLIKARKAIGNIAPGCAEITPAFNLSNAMWVIHAVGTAWRGGTQGELEILRHAYDSALEIAATHHCKSVAFPLMGAGRYGFPKETAISVAIKAFTDFLETHEMKIILVLFSNMELNFAGNYFKDIQSYVDANYVEAAQTEEYGGHGVAHSYQELMSDHISLNHSLNRPRSSFYDRLEKIIKEKKEAAEKDEKKRWTTAKVYKRAGMNKQWFSKIRNDANFQPSKNVAVRFALALELDYDAAQNFLEDEGYTLTKNNKTDLIVEYYIKAHRYDLVEINIALFDCGIPLLTKESR